MFTPTHEKTVQISYIVTGTWVKDLHMFIFFNGPLVERLRHPPFKRGEQGFKSPTGYDTFQLR